MDLQSSSQLLEKAVNEFSKLPGVGRKTALRQVLHMLRQETDYTTSFTQALNDLRENVQYCSICHNISDAAVCAICSNTQRNASQICVVENLQDVTAIENTGQYSGRYHVLGGLISPMDGIGPDDIEISSLVRRIEEENVEEVILALSSTMEGDTTAFFITRKLAPYPIRLTALARGISVGDELEYTDEQTLGRALLARTEVKG